eukprot:TRINITY_DN6849_c0_g1_i5.p1 TRINITY_DN6849_c0_g1~~TRINITY_DN6849_c0_g1_i5.p1  ORF type:complete len:497 (-),score=103.84 TRINITY_DN6849_c0_g1_i5:96-1502(-)
MCIRDRYQRRVHGESFIRSLKMRFVACLLVAGLIGVVISNVLSPEADSRVEGTDLLLEAEVPPSASERQENAGAGRFGYLRVSDSSASQLYWYFKPARWSTSNNETSYPIVLWLQGGPGRTSMFGNLFQIGPNLLSFNAASGKWEEQPRSNSWSDEYNLLFIDQPVGVGYSIAANDGDIPTNIEKVTEHLMYVLKQLFNDKLKAFAPNDLYIAGEGFASHYIPPLAKAIIEMEAPKLPLQGVLLNGPLIDMVNQVGELGTFSESLGLINKWERREVELNIAQIRQKIAVGKLKDAYTAFQNTIGKVINSGGGFNPNNYRQTGDFKSPNLNIYFNYPEVKTTYGGIQDFVSLNGKVREALVEEFVLSRVNELAFVVEKIPVLIYIGQDNFVTNVAGTQVWLSKLEWSKQKEFNQADFTQFKVNEIPVGRIKSTDNLSFAVINNSGMLLESEQVLATLEVVKRWVKNKRL